MEDETKGMQDQDDQALHAGNELEAAGSQDGTADESTERPRKKHHDDHHVSRKYRMFSNYSSDRDMPHTSTSF